MRRIDQEKEFKSAFEATKREALKAFANDDVYIEKFIEKPKHIEVQILADKHGNYIHLFERECSIQRRHQKIIEESPSQFINEKVRKKITESAINAAKACKYFNAGTIEFLVDKNKNFFFLEMNTRLQVEHPVTELITGTDLVKEQILIASGNKLSIQQDDLKINGYSLECRVYAEDSYNDFLPSTGRINHYKAPSGPGVRLDSGFELGSEISVYYDPLISKLITWGADKKQAVSRMKRALDEYQIAGVTTNISFLKNILEHQAFLNGSYDINFVENIFMSDGKNGVHSISKQYENAAALMSAILLLETKNNIIRSNSIDKNKWQEQLFDE